MLKHLNNVNKEVVSEGINHPDLYNMATTVAGTVISHEELLAFNLGDSRVYHFTGQALIQLSKDHTVSSSMLYCYSNPEAITRYIGGDGHSCFPSYKRSSINTNDIILLCSDGIYKSICDTELACMMGKEDTLNDKARTIVNYAIDNGSCDDRSIVLIKALD